MKVLLFCHTGMPPLYGTESVVDALGRGLSALGVETTVACCRAQAPFNEFHPPYRLKVFEGGRIRLLRKLRLRHQLARTLKHGFDLVHGHGALPEGEWLVQLRPRHVAPVVLTCHRPLRREPHRDKPHHSGFYRRLMRRQHALREADALVAVSSSMARSFADFCGRGDHIHQIPNGVWIDSDPTPPSSLPFGLGQEKYILGIGRLAREKGFDLLLRAFARTFGKRRDLSLVLAGDGPDQAYLEETAAALGLGPRLVLPGYVQRSEKEALTRGALFLVVPSRVSEAFGLVVLEAFAAGNTVIGADVGGIPDLIRHGENGMLFPMDDEDALSSSMEQLADEADLRSRLRRGGKALVGGYSWDRICRRHLDLYEALVGSGHLR